MTEFLILVSSIKFNNNNITLAKVCSHRGCRTLYYIFNRITLKDDNNLRHFTDDSNQMSISPIIKKYKLNVIQRIEQIVIDITQ